MAASNTGGTANEPSLLLTDEENQIIFTVIGQRRIVSLYHHFITVSMSDTSYSSSTDVSCYS